MIKKFDQLLDSFSKAGIVMCLFLMLTFSVASIVLRWFGISLHWIDPAVRHFVFLAAFLGGSLATGADQNIKIDLLTRVLEAKNQDFLGHIIRQVVTFITLVTVLILAKATWGFVKVELDYGKDVFWGIHSSVLVGIIPFGFLLISLRLVCRLCLNLKDSSLESKR